MPLHQPIDLVFSLCLDEPESLEKTQRRIKALDVDVERFAGSNLDDEDERVETVGGAVHPTPAGYES